MTLPPYLQETIKKEMNSENYESKMLKEFDEKFPELFYFDGGHRDANQDNYTTCQEEVKSFLLSRHYKLIEEVVKKIEEKEQPYTEDSKCGGCGECEACLIQNDDETWGYNQALEDLKTEINNLMGKE